MIVSPERRPSWRRAGGRIPTRMKRLLALLILSVLILTGCQSAPPTRTQDPADERPNILLIITDDQRYDTMDYMPLTRRCIFDEGVTFSRAYVTTKAKNATLSAISAAASHCEAPRSLQARITPSAK